MRAITLLVFAIALCKVYALDQPNYAVPWWAAAYDSSRVNQLIKPITLAEGRAIAPAGTSNTDPVYVPYQGGAVGTVMLETGEEVEEEVAENVDLSSKMHSLIALDSALESPTIHVPSMQLFNQSHYSPVLQPGAVFHASVKQANNTRSIVDEVLLHGELEYGFKKMPISFKALEDAEITVKKHDDDMAEMKEHINGYEQYYWNNGGLNVPEHITGGSFMDLHQSNEQLEEDFHGVLSELESALDSENIEEKMMQAGMDEANREEKEEMKSFLAIQDAMATVEDAEELEEDETELNASFVEGEGGNVNRDINEHMIPIPVAVTDYIARQEAAKSMANFHGVPVVTVKSLGTSNPINATAGTWDVHVGPAPATVVDAIITKAVKHPKKLVLKNRLLVNATDTNTEAGKTLSLHRDSFNVPVVEPLSHGEVLADLKPQPAGPPKGADGLIHVVVAK